jgi:LuxR family maltose regulon positive regulatory protein
LLDEADKDLTCFLSYLIAALQTIKANIGTEVLTVLHASRPQPPSIESILTTLLNEIATIPEGFVLVLDDYHIMNFRPVDGSCNIWRVPSPRPLNAESSSKSILR